MTESEAIMWACGLVIGAGCVWAISERYRRKEIEDLTHDVERLLDIVNEQIDIVNRFEAALIKISSPSQTENLLWWQIEARAALGDTGNKS